MLAVIIPYYKFTFFEATLQSLANQTDKRFKVYIGDDASPEDCISLLQQFEGSFDFVYHRFDINLGSISLTQQWERCISLSGDEEWIMILGDDDVLGDNVVEEFYTAKGQLELEKINIMKCSSILINESGDFISKVYNHPIKERVTDAYFKHHTLHSRSSLSEYFFSRKSYEKFGFKDYPLGWHSDDMAWLEFSNCGIAYCSNDALVQVRISLENISGKIDNLNLKLTARILFMEEIMMNKWSMFTSHQKKYFLFDYGTLIKEFGTINFKKVFLGFYKFCLMGEIYNGLKFIRRIFWIKKK